MPRVSFLKFQEYALFDYLFKFTEEEAVISVTVTSIILCLCHPSRKAAPEEIYHGPIGINYDFGALQIVPNPFFHRACIFDIDRVVIIIKKYRRVKAGCFKNRVPVIIPIAKPSTE